MSLWWRVYGRESVAGYFFLRDRETITLRDVRNTANNELDDDDGVENVR